MGMVFSHKFLHLLDMLLLESDVTLAEPQFPCLANGSDK